MQPAKLILSSGTTCTRPYLVFAHNPFLVADLRCPPACVLLERCKLHYIRLAPTSLFIWGHAGASAGCNVISSGTRPWLNGSSQLASPVLHQRGTRSKHLRGCEVKGRSGRQAKYEVAVLKSYIIRTHKTVKIKQWHDFSVSFSLLVATVAG